jgi:ribosomal protein S18 acetylase RimI-like enzyme
VATVTVRGARAEDAAGIARIGQENGEYYARLAPELYRVPEEEAAIELIANDDEWRSLPTSLALVADAEGQIAGYLEATLQEPIESASAQGQRDVGKTRLFINYVGTANEFKRQGVATELVQVAEEWARANGAEVALCDTWIDSPLSVPFWEERMGYERRAIIFRKQLT